MAIIWTETATSLALLSRTERYAILFLVMVGKATLHRLSYVRAIHISDMTRYHFIVSNDISCDMFS